MSQLKDAGTPNPATLRVARPVGDAFTAGDAISSTVATTVLLPIAGAGRVRIRGIITTTEAAPPSPMGALSFAFRRSPPNDGTAYAVALDPAAASQNVVKDAEFVVDIEPSGESLLAVTFTPAGGVDPAKVISATFLDVLELHVAGKTVAVASIAAGEAVLGIVGGITTLVADEFTRPADATPYAAGDAVSATTSNTGTTPLRALTNIARVLGGTGYLTRIRLWTDQAANIATFRIHFYRVAAPTTAVPGDNAQMTLAYTNFLERVGSINLPAMQTSTVAAGSTAAQTGVVIGQDMLPLAFACGAASRTLYYRIETLSIFTPASGQKFYLEVGAENN